MRNVDEALKYYQDHRNAWPFDPDGQCLKICRTARDIDAMFPTALSAQHGTPEQYRVYSLNDVKRGMVMYFDDPNDSNPFGHIVTCLGRDKEKFLLTWTNDAAPNVLRIVYASFFPRMWGDQFQFAATWLNGVELDTGRVTTAATDPEPKKRKLRNIEHAISDIQRAIAHQKRQGHDRLVAALQRDSNALLETLKEFQ
jgi:hypothetical protein